MSTIYQYLLLKKKGIVTILPDSELLEEYPELRQMEEDYIREREEKDVDN